MDDSRRSSSSVKPSTVAKLTPSDFQGADRCAGGMVSEEIKENDQQLNRGGGLGARNLKKEHKNFMSTTISAASKKKKVLAEKNDAPPSECSGTYSERNPDIKKPDQIHGHPDAAPQVAPFPSGPHIHRSGEETVVSSETQPYDPLTNYLSPRPKFLRYNPNRRREIYLRRTRELKATEGSSGVDLSGSFEVESASSEGPPSDPPASPSVKLEGLDVKSLQDKETRENLEEKEDDDTDEEQEEEEEEEEEGRPSCCSLVWKNLLLLGLLFFSTCYISSVHPSSAVSSLGNFRFSKGNLFKIQDSCQEVAENVGINLDKFVGTYMNTCIQGHFNELANWGNGINSNRLDDLPNSGDFGGEKLQDEGNVKLMWADDVNSNVNLVMVEGKSDEREESQAESEMTIAEGSGMLIDYIPVMAEGEIEEYASYSKETQDDSEMARADDSYQNEGSFNIVKAPNLEHENGFTGAVTYEQHAEDVFMETEIEETDDVAEQLSKPDQSPQKESVSDHEEEETGTLCSFEQGMKLEKKWDISSPPSFPDTVEDANSFRFYRFKLFTTVLMVLTVAGSLIIGFLRFRKTKISVEDSLATFPNSGLAAEGRDSSKLAKMEKTVDKGSNFLVSADKYKEVYEGHPPALKLVGETRDKGLNFLVDADKYKEVYESHPPTVKLVEEKSFDSFFYTAKCREPYERNPPAVKLLDEFSIAEQGISETKNSSLRKTTIRIEEQHSAPVGVSMRKSLPFAEEANRCSSEFLTPESASCRTPAQGEIVRKQKSGHRQESAKVASTPVRRSSRIRNRVTSPGA